MCFNRYYYHGCLKHLFASIGDFSSPVLISTPANNFLVTSPAIAGEGSVQKLPARILLQLFTPYRHLSAREKAQTPSKMLAGYCAAQLYEWQGKHLHVSLVTFNHWNCPLEGSDLGQPKQCFKETLEVRTALDSYDPHKWNWCHASWLQSKTLISYLLHSQHSHRSARWLISSVRGTAENHTT